MKGKLELMFLIISLGCLMFSVMLLGDLIAERQFVSNVNGLVGMSVVDVCKMFPHDCHVTKSNILILRRRRCFRKIWRLFLMDDTVYSYMQISNGKVIFFSIAVGLPSMIRRSSWSTK